MQYLPLENVTAGMILSKDVFASDDSISPIVREGALLSERILRKLAARGVEGVYVGDGLPQETGEAVPQHDIEKSAPVIDTELRDEALDNLEDFFNTAQISGDDVHESSARIVQQMDTVVDKLVGSILQDRSALVNISNLRSYDDYTFHHSLSVAVLSIAIGQHMGMGSHQLNRIGMCAMMHDIGKTAIPVEIIRKPSKLDEHEFSLIKTHSSAGYGYLSGTDIGDEEIWQGVLYHHEKVDGTGYPEGIKGSHIPLMSRIISVADVYDALTSNRPYRTPMLPSDALEYLMGGIGSAFEFDMVEALVKKVDLYPVGSTIELSDGRYAAVLNNEHPMRPVVLVLGTNQVMDLYHDRQCLSIVVKRLVPDLPLAANG